MLQTTKDDCDKISISSSDSQLSSHAEIDLENDGNSDVECDANQEDGICPVRYKKKDRSLM